MTYHKPKDVRYVDMCIYIDNNIYNGTYDEEVVFKYLYLLVHMLAIQAGYFKKYSNYDEFSIYAATQLYLRLTDPRQFEVDEAGNPALPKIKSILNYIHCRLYPLKVDFEQSTYYNEGVTSYKENQDDNRYSFNDLLIKDTNHLHIADFNFLLNDIKNTCKHFLKSIPYKENTIEWLNIYTSVMLTLLSSITPDRYGIERMRYLKSGNKYTQSKMNDIYDEANENCTILFHLPDHMYNYITVLARQLKHLIAADLSYILHTKVSEDFVVQESIALDFAEGTLFDDDTTAT